MKELREKLEELILLKGTADKEVLRLSQLLDNYISEYYIDKPNSNMRNFNYLQAI